jgi:hypothetical protein
MNEKIKSSTVTGRWSNPAVSFSLSFFLMGDEEDMIYSLGSSMCLFSSKDSIVHYAFV